MEQIFAPLLIAFLAIAAIWGIWLFPALSNGRREAPLSSTEDFDRWTHVMADVQRRRYSEEQISTRDIVRNRRRRVLLALVVLAVATLAAAIVFGSIRWLMGHLVVDAVVAWYIGMLMQVKQRQASRSELRHLATMPHDADEPGVRIVAGQ